MWYLVPRSAPGNRLLLPPNKDVLVGRSDGHVMVDDRSVSRRHAQLRVNVSPGESQMDARVVVKDTSKFGTIVNGRRVVGGERTLQHGDVITFGAENIHNFVLKREPLVVCCSAVNAPTRVSVREKVAKLGGETLSHWTDECTLLVVSKVSVTIKVIGALIRGAPIVRPDYLDQLTEFHNGHRSKPPDLSEFQPIVASESQHLENVEVDLLPRTERRQLFADCTFVFLTKGRFERLSSSLVLGGAQCLLWEEERPSCDEQLLVAENTLVFFEENPTRWGKRVYKILSKHRRRPILDAEIGFAVLACSREDFCNVNKKCDQLLYRHGISVENLTQNPFDLTSETPAAPQPSAQTSAQPAAQPSGQTSAQQSVLNFAQTPVTTPRRSAEMKQESTVKTSVLVPQTPPVTSAAVRSPRIPETSITTVPESMDLKVEAPSSEEPFRRLGERKRREEKGGVSGGEEEDPFDSIRTRGKRRGGLQDSIAQLATPLSEAPTRVVREDSVGNADTTRKSQSTTAMKLSLSATEAVDGEGIGETSRREKRSWEGEESEAELARKKHREVKSSQGGEKPGTLPENGDSRSAAQSKGRQEEEESAGRKSGDERSGWDPGLPRNCLQVVVVPLLRCREAPRRREERNNAAVLNFKKFRKIRRGGPAPKRLLSVALVSSQRARLEEMEAVSVSQGQSNPLDSEADRVFEEMLQMPSRRRQR